MRRDLLPPPLRPSGGGLESMAGGGGDPPSPGRSSAGREGAASTGKRVRGVGVPSRGAATAPPPAQSDTEHRADKTPTVADTF
jgi:hypothetical protein